MKATSMRGKPVDMLRLMAENGHRRALGNASMNARGDLIDNQGNVVKPREELAREYHKNNPKAVKQVSLRDISEEVFISPAEAIEQVKDHAHARKAKRKIADTD